MNQSVRLTLRRGQHLDLSVEEVSERGCRLRVEPDPRGDDYVVVRLTVESRREPGDTQGEVDHAAYRAATTEQVGIDDRNVVGVGDQTGSFVNYLSSHQETSQNINDFSSFMSLPQSKKKVES